ncbi:hypothetical protein OK18_17330 [Chryseobacterium gallinarum]|uniref:DUF1990 family protein n=1 Tax=Chryseobacterium gallinarum TaxID=1324352 RepID=A0A0G3M840_CHRGL|nr:hypothetical protein [Chryseobacterium gallinarum]AKK74133.1 hypothetical protein OK18_17330 [Chryseobacterium gallinarum]MCL8537959.1 hypothetical protein [Chryseobacterium gallinarum]
MKPKSIKGVPRQISGGFHDTESEKQFAPELLPLKFEILKRRFFMINHWQSYCGSAFAAFKLYDSNAGPVDRDPQKGDFIRIDIPGPGEPEARGYDWVEILEICYYQDSFSETIMIICKPSRDPKNKKSSHIAHFYSSKATSTFMISKTSSHLKTAVYGRNESPNFKAKFIDVIRNLLVAAGGIMGIAKIQWKVLTDGFLDFE